MELIRLMLHNWQSFKGVHTIDIGPGLTCIQGINEDDEGAVSNRSGKTSFLNAISFAYYGRTPLVAAAPDLINDDGCKWAIVEAESDDMTVRRHLHHPDYGNQVWLRLGKGEPKEVEQLELDKRLGTFDAFISTVFFGTNYSDFLDKVLRRPNDARDMLTQLMPKLRVFDYAWEWVKKKQDVCASEIRRFENEISNKEGMISQLQEAMRTAVRRIEEFENQRISDGMHIAREIDELQAGMKWPNRKALAKLIDKAQGQLEPALREAEGYDEELQQLNEAIAVEANNISKAKRDITSFRKGICPTCGKPFADREAVTKNENRLAFIEQKHSTHVARKNEINSKREKIVEEYSALDSTLASMKEAERVHERIHELKQRQKENDDRINPYVHDEADSGRKAAALTKELDKVKASMRRLNDLQSYYDWWYRGYGARGIKNYLFDDVLFGLSDMAEYYLGKLSNSTIHVRFEPRKQKKSGGYSESIGLSIYSDKDPRPFFTWSQSERKKVNLSVDLAMNELLMRSFNSPFRFAVFDESFDGLDQLGVEMFCSLLREELRNIPAIFVVSHSPYDQYFDRFIRIVKRNGCSSFLDGRKKLNRK